MNIKVAAFSALTLGIIGVFMADGLPSKAGDTYSKESCIRSISKQADKDLFKAIDPAGLCGCLADLKVTRDTDYQTVKPCLEKNLSEHIVNACEKDEAIKQALRDKPKSPDDELKPNEEPIGPPMNCTCVADRSNEWVWKNFEAAMRSKTLKNEEALGFATDMMNECRWK